MIPPDPRLLHTGIAQTLGIHTKIIIHHLGVLKKKGLVLPFRVGRKEFYKITLAGIREVEKCVTTTVEGELSTSKIGIKGVRKRAIGAGN